MKKYNLSEIMKRAWELVKKFGLTIYGGLKKSWKEAKEKKMEEVKNVVVEHFYSFNKRRYSTPWVCLMNNHGEHDFSVSVGTYTGNGKNGEEGDLVVYNPVAGQVYGYGQKDYRGNGTIKKYAKWDGVKFVTCDKLGK